ncbi:MAG: hypothetical protein GC206_10685 [Alphaproteobacteria bacterium]|nr:hypothetical protein [Alphaproteobacteria bacterium]
MRTWRAGLAAVLCAGAAAAQEAEEAPAPEPRFTAFQDVCIDARQSFATLEAAAQAQGWTSVAESARPELPRVMTQARSYAAQGMTIQAIRLFSRPLVDEERAYLVLSHYDNSGQTVIGCSFFAFDAPHTVPGALVREWVGTAADDWREQPNRFVTQLWTNPPSMPGVAVFRHMYLQRQENAAPDSVAGMILSIVATPTGAAATGTAPAE